MALDGSPAQPERIELTALTPAQVLAARGDLAAVYRAAFSGPPYFEPDAHVTYFARRTLPKHAACSGFRCIVARSADHGIVGFAYGYASAPGQWWRDQIAPQLRRNGHGCWLRNAFELVELAVVPAMQGRGIGGRLHDTLLTDLPHEHALLSTYAEPTPALHLYQRRGWVRLVDRFNFPGDNIVPMTIMGLPLTGRGTRNAGPL